VGNVVAIGSVPRAFFDLKGKMIVSCKRRDFPDPLDASTLYFARSEPGRVARFYIAASADGRTVEGIQDPTRFKALLSDAISSGLGTVGFRALMQATLDSLAGIETPIPFTPRYPQIGDLGVGGTLTWFVTIPFNDPSLGLITRGVGRIHADIAANGYTNPGATNVNFDFYFYQNNPPDFVVGQRVTFDVVSDTYADNVVAA
jgi:hypothetical protein